MKRHLTDQLRRQLRAETRKLSVRAAAQLVGLSPATLHRFLAGAAPGQRTIDVLYARYRDALGVRWGKSARAAETS